MYQQDIIVSNYQLTTYHHLAPVYCLGHLHGHNVVQNHCLHWKYTLKMDTLPIGFPQMYSSCLLKITTKYYTRMKIYHYDLTMQLFLWGELYWKNSRKVPWTIIDACYRNTCLILFLKSSIVDRKSFWLFNWVSQWHFHSSGFMAKIK